MKEFSLREAKHCTMQHGYCVKEIISACNFPAPSLVLNRLVCLKQAERRIIAASHVGMLRCVF